MKREAVQTEELIHRLASQARPGRLWPPMTRCLLWFATALLFTAAGIYHLGFRHDIDAVSRDPHFLLETFFTLATALASAAGAFYLSVPGSERNRLTRLVPTLTIAAWFILLAIQVVKFPLHDFSLHQSWENGSSCLIYTIVLGLFPGVFLFSMLKRGAPIRRAWAGALAALSMTALGALTISFACAASSVVHVLLWHFLPVVAVGLVGALLGRLILKW